MSIEFFKLINFFSKRQKRFRNAKTTMQEPHVQSIKLDIFCEAKESTVDPSTGGGLISLALRDDGLRALCLLLWLASQCCAVLHLLGAQAV